MASIYPPRKQAPGAARRNFRGGVWKQEIGEHGQVKSVQVPASYWRQPEEVIPLDGLKEYWEHNNTQFTRSWHKAFNQRLKDDYLYLCMTYDPELCEDPQGTSHKKFVEKQEQFFDQVAELDRWPFWKYTKQKTFRSFPSDKGIVSQEFKDYCQVYDAYLDYKSYRFRKDDRACEYRDWRREMLWRDESVLSRYSISGQAGYQYRDEDEQLGDMSLQQDMPEPTEYRQTSIYDYLVQGHLVPHVGMSDLDAMRREYESEFDTEVSDNEALIAAAKAMAKEAKQAERDAARQPDVKPDEDVRVIPGGLADTDAGDDEAAKKPGRDMSDLNRLVADLESGKQEESQYGW